MSGKKREVDGRLDEFSLETSQLPHPVELLTVDVIADASGVARTTILTAASSVESSRFDVLAGAIEQLDVSPGEATWDARRRCLGSTDAVAAVATIVAARAGDLANDPAFPYFLGGFEFLESDAVTRAVARANSELVTRCAPFVETALAEALRTASASATHERPAG